jgi:alkylation response protein AidB-like acyl-CoA dehydrogenase
VRFELDDDRRLLRESTARFLARECPITRVRASEPTGHDNDLWKEICGLGLVEVALDTSAGLTDLVVVGQELGRRLAPVPYVDAVLAARLLALAGDDGAQAVASGDVIAAVLRRAGGGAPELAPAGAVATVVVGLDGGELVAVDSPPGEHLDNVGSLPAAWRDLRGSRRRVVASGPEARGAHARATVEARILTSAALVGLAQEALRLGLEHVKDRHQFGVPIGSFQTVAHRLADCATAVEGAELITYKAAWSADRRTDDAEVLAAIAVAFTTRAARAAASESLHFHGGYGYTLEYDIQLHFRRAQAWSLIGGDPHDALVEVGRAVVASGGWD